MIWRGKYPRLTILTQGTGAFYLNSHLRALAIAMVRIFVPIFLYKTGGFLAIAAYYTALRLIVLISSIPISKMIEKIGFRRSVSLSAILLIAEMTAMAIATQYPWMIAVAAILSGINIPMYWIARDSALSQDVDSKKMGKTIANIASLEQISAILGPFVAGIIVVAWGFLTLFLVAAVILTISAVPLWWMPHHTHKNGVSLKGFFQWLGNKRYSHQAMGMVGICLEDYGLTAFWPLALFLMNIKLSTMGIIYSLVAVMSLMIKIVSGRMFDKLKARRDWADEIVFGVSTVGSALIWPIRIFLSTVGAVFVADVAAELFQGFYYNFHADYAHLGGKRMGSIAFWVYVEMIYSAAAVAIMGLFIAGVTWGIWKELLFATISIWVLASMAIAKESNLR